MAHMSLLLLNGGKTNSGKTAKKAFRFIHSFRFYSFRREFIIFFNQFGFSDPDHTAKIHLVYYKYAIDVVPELIPIFIYGGISGFCPLSRNTFYLILWLHR